MSKYLKGGVRDGAKLRLVVTSNKRRANGQELMHRKFLSMRKNFFLLCSECTWEQGVWRGCGISLTGELRTQSCALCTGMVLPEQGGGTRLMPCGPLQPGPFCDALLHLCISGTTATLLLFPSWPSHAKLLINLALVDNFVILN